MKTVRAFAPASVSNVCCGFDLFGFAVRGPGDLVEARRSDQPGIVIREITGDDDRLPRQAESNTAGVAAARLLARHGAEAVGVELAIHKQMPLASGLGSSAASAVAAVVAVNALLDLGSAREILLACAVEGERMACGTAHADNAAPSLYGGFVMVRGLRVDRLPVPPGLACALVRPDVEVETRSARQALGDSVPLTRAVTQWGNTAALVAGLCQNDLRLLASALVDVVAEPLRTDAVPGFDQAKDAALAAGALGAGLSGSGPSIFALVESTERAQEVARAMSQALQSAAGLSADTWVTLVEAPGARVVR